MTAAAASSQRVIDDTRRWLERAVIGLNLCPFAKAVQGRGLVHFAVSGEPVFAPVLQDLERELVELIQTPADVRETTLLILPSGFEEFLMFNELVRNGERLIARRKLEGVIQLASFHPAFVFAGSDDDDLSNCTNRSPYPTLHLLREESIGRAVAAFPRPESIYEANVQTLKRLGADGWLGLGVGRS